MFRGIDQGVGLVTPGRMRQRTAFHSRHFGASRVIAVQPRGQCRRPRFQCFRHDALLPLKSLAPNPTVGFAREKAFGLLAFSVRKSDNENTGLQND
ncbi:hypothetical protein BCAL1129 [Burkholderia cenocepacia J2315]|uniref:Uncharacterized protein n=1 Tax=Burkholderia cenocepacia (strain ATCC BAA-245 / DSM 16553 / LMG 16656 / NCTC 13227 / J2315 / CF5610) TaxID=216591 RepID=B4EDL5_BURCJ|nr:hypothetical protein BCAL1129 [Burkholderia cenocepacia J2315]